MQLSATTLKEISRVYATLDTSEMDLTAQVNYMYMLNCTELSSDVSRVPANYRRTSYAFTSRASFGSVLRAEVRRTASIRTKFSERAFSFSGPVAWNSLPANIRCTTNRQTFNTLLWIIFAPSPGDRSRDMAHAHRRSR